jgi:hypothetical protein
MMDDGPMPPMDDSGMDMGPDPMAGGPDDMGDPDDMGGPDPNDMGGEDPMGGDPDDMGGPDDMGDPDDIGGPDDAGGSPEDDELTNIINNLSIEDKAAVTKYAKSMVDDSSDEGGIMPESRFSFSRIIDETLNSIMYKKKDNGIKRPEKKLNSRQRDNKSLPFVSPY